MQVGRGENVSTATRKIRTCAKVVTGISRSFEVSDIEINAFIGFLFVF